MITWSFPKVSQVGTMHMPFSKGKGKDEEMEVPRARGRGNSGVEKSSGFEARRWGVQIFALVLVWWPWANNLTFLNLPVRKIISEPTSQGCGGDQIGYCK